MTNKVKKKRVDLVFLTEMFSQKWLAVIYNLETSGFDPISIFVTFKTPIIDLFMVENSPLLCLKPEAI